MTEPDQHPLLSKACSKAAFIEVFPDDLRDHRAVKVCVLANNPDGTTRQLADVQRVFAYVPPP